MKKIFIKMFYLNIALLLFIFISTLNNANAQTVSGGISIQSGGVGISIGTGGAGARPTGSVYSPTTSTGCSSTDSSGTATFGSIGCLISNLTNNVVKMLAGLFGACALTVFMYGLVIFIKDAGIPAEVEKGKKFMLWGLVALFVMVSVWGIVRLFQSLTGINPTQTQVVIPTVCTNPNGCNSGSSATSNSNAKVQLENGKVINTNSNGLDSAAAAERCRSLGHSWDPLVSNCYDSDTGCASYNLNTGTCGGSGSVPAVNVKASPAYTDQYGNSCSDPSGARKAANGDILSCANGIAGEPCSPNTCASGNTCDTSSDPRGTYGKCVAN